MLFTIANIMQSASARRYLDAEELASRRAVVTGFVEIESMPRLLDIVTGTPSAVAYRIEFAREVPGRPRIVGRIEGMLPLTCQRCLDSLDWRFDMEFKSLLVGDEREEPHGEEAVVCPDGRIALVPMIEDEVLLAVPSAPVHAHGTCEAPAIPVASGQMPPTRSHPFAALQSLRSRQGPERSG